MNDRTQSHFLSSLKVDVYCLRLSDADSDSFCRWQTSSSQCLSVITHHRIHRLTLSHLRTYTAQYM